MTVRARFCAVLAATLMASGAAHAQFISHIDLAPIPPLDDECPALGAEPLAPNAPHPVKGLIGGATLNYTQALNNLWALLEGGVTSKALDALQSDSALHDPMAASELAGAALFHRKPLAALALLLQAHAGAPDEPLHLVNLAGLSNHLGLHREALAMAGEAERKKIADARIGGMRLRAVLLSNKGYALTATGRPKQAEAALREAIRLDPNLAEAYTNLAFALGEQEQCESAAYYLRAGKTRRPAQVLAGSQRESAAGDDSAAPLPARLPVSDALDLSRGRAGLLPAMHLATSPVDADNEGLKAHLKKLMDTREARDAQKRQLKFAEQARKQRSAWAKRDAIGVLSADRAEWLQVLSSEYAEQVSVLLQLAGVPDQSGPSYDAVTMGAGVLAEETRHPDPELQPRVHGALQATLEMIARRERASENFDSRREMIVNAFNKERDACNKLRDPGLCIAAAQLRRDTAICTAAKEAAQQRMGSMVAFNAAFRDLYGEASRRLSAVAAHFSDPAHHEEARARMNWFANYATNLLAVQVNGHRAAQAMGAAECRASDKRMVDLLFEYLKGLEAAACKSGGKSGSFSVSAIEVGANCEEVSVTASTPGKLGLFAKVSYEQSKRYEYVKAGKERFLQQQAGLDPRLKLHLPDYGAAFDGKLTIYAGVHAGAGGVSGKAGGYVEFNGLGDITDYGRQSEVTKTTSIKPGQDIAAGQEKQLYTSGKESLMSPRHAGDE